MPHEKRVFKKDRTGKQNRPKQSEEDRKKMKEAKKQKKKGG
jgi:hypothetical protein